MKDVSLYEVLAMTCSVANWDWYVFGHEVIVGPMAWVQKAKATGIPACDYESNRK